MTEQQTREYYHKQMHRHENRWIQEVRKMFAGQLRGLKALIRQAQLPEVIIQELPKVINTEGTMAMYQKLYLSQGEIYYTVTQAGLNEKKAIQRLSASKKLPPDDPFFMQMLSLIESQVGYRITTIQQTSRDLVIAEIQDIIAIMEEEGLSIAEGAKLIESRVRSKWLQTAQWRAARIARTETGTIANMASEMGAQNTGLNYVKKWLSFVDDRTREDHILANGEEVDKGESFNIGGSTMRYPCDPNGAAEQVINCRCVLQYVVPD